PQDRNIRDNFHQLKKTAIRNRKAVCGLIGPVPGGVKPFVSRGKDMARRQSLPRSPYSMYTCIS
ncbi:MAG: hypothetical protein ACOX7P_04610, partial [Oscillospiraceae bacterium]